MLQIKNNAMLDKEQADAEAERKELEQSEEFDTSLSAYIDRCWTKAKEAKRPVQDQLLKNKRQIKGIYEADKKAAIKALRVPEIYFLITHVKQSNAEAWIEEILFQPNSLPWDIRPTPLPDLPDEIKTEIIRSIIQNYVDISMQSTGNPFTDPAMVNDFISANMEAIKDEVRLKVLEYAGKTADRMRDKINDQLTEGGWYKAISDAIPNIVMKTGIVKGPIYRKRRTRTPKVNPETGSMYLSYEEKIIPTYESRSPFDIYPAPGATSFDDGYLIDRIRLTPIQLQELIGVDGYREDEIRAILNEYEEGTLRAWLGSDLPDDELNSIDDKETASVTIYDSDKIDCLEFWGAVQGAKLIEYGMSREEISDPDIYYNCTAWKIGSHIIKAMLNDDINGKKPYYKSSFYDDREAFWGVGLPEIISDVQQGCNACGRAIITNVGISCLTGDMVVYREGQDRKYSQVTLQEIWDRKDKPHTGVGRLRLRSLNTDTGEFFGNKIMDVFNNGDADVFEVKTENGYRIKATKTHRFMNEFGEWQLLDDFDVGSLIAVNGQEDVPRCIDCGRETKGKGVRCKKCAATLAQSYPGQKQKVCIECGAPTVRRGVRCKPCSVKLQNNSWNTEQVRRSRENRDARENTARQRYDCQSKKKDFCENCGGKENKLEQHHIDRDPYNNRENNLKTLCYVCHKKIHAYEDSFGDAYLHRYVSYDVISSIEYVGKETVYNLYMQAPYHNFVCNGFVSKNSGPMVERNIDRVKPEDRTDDTIYPLKVFDSTNEDMLNQAKAYEFYQPPFIADRMIAVFDRFVRLADEHSGVPAYAHGDPHIGGAGRTASGLSMLMAGAARGIKDVIKSIDDNIIAPSVRNQYFLNIEMFENYGLICDFQIEARGSVAMLAKEQQAIRKIELLNMTSNPLDAQIIGIDGRRFMLRDVLKSMDMDVDNIMPDAPLSEDKLKEMQVLQQMSSINNGNSPSPAKTDATGARVQGGDNQAIPGGAYGRAT